MSMLPNTNRPILQIVQKKQPTSMPGLTSDTDILANAHVSDKVPRHLLEELSPQDALTICAGRLLGERLVYVHWPTGECALMFCASGSDMPEPPKVIRGFRSNPLQMQKGALE